MFTFTYIYAISLQQFNINNSNDFFLLLRGKRIILRRTLRECSDGDNIHAFYFLSVIYFSVPSTFVYCVLKQTCVSIYPAIIRVPSNCSVYSKTVTEKSRFLLCPELRGDSGLPKSGSSQFFRFSITLTEDKQRPSREQPKSVKKMRKKKPN